MIVHTAFTSQSNGNFYPAGFYILQSEYLSLDQEDRQFVDLPITRDESAEMMADAERYEAEQELASYREERERDNWNYSEMDL